MGDGFVTFLFLDTLVLDGVDFWFGSGGCWM